MDADAVRYGHQSLGTGLESMSSVDVLNHQLRTPLSALVGHLELLQDSDLDLPEHAERSFEVMAGAVERLVDVTDWISRAADRQTGGAEVVMFPGPAGSRDGRVKVRRQRPWRARRARYTYRDFVALMAGRPAEPSS